MNDKQSQHKLRKGILRTDSLLLKREDVTSLLIAANPGTDALIIIIITLKLTRSLSISLEKEYEYLKFMF